MLSVETKYNTDRSECRLRMQWYHAVFICLKIKHSSKPTRFFANKRKQDVYASEVDERICID